MDRLIQVPPPLRFLALPVGTSASGAEAQVGIGREVNVTSPGPQASAFRADSSVSVSLRPKRSPRGGKRVLRL